MRPAFSNAILPGVLALFLLTGCRTYGDYGNVEEHREQLVVLVEQFETNLARNQADLRQLAQGSAGVPAMRPYAERMAALVALQEALLLEQRLRLDELVETDDYRDLHRAYGAFITEQQMLLDLYAGIGRQMRGETEAGSYIDSEVEHSRYVFVPPQYMRISNRMRPAGLPQTVTLPLLGAPPIAAPVLSDSVASVPTAPTAEGEAGESMSQ